MAPFGIENDISQKSMEVSPYLERPLRSLEQARADIAARKLKTGKVVALGMTGRNSNRRAARAAAARAA